MDRLKDAVRRSRGMKKSAREQRRNINNIGMFDLSRGLLMLFVVLGHSITLFFEYWEIEVEVSLLLLPILLGKVLTYGLLPVFFIMSGYGFRMQTMKKCAKNQARYLLKPYLYVAIIVTVAAVLKKLLLGRSVLDALRYQSFPFLLALPSESKVPIGEWDTASIGFMWFFVTLGLAWIVMNLIFQLKNEALRFLIIAGLAVCGVQLPAYAFMPFCLAQVLCSIAYMYLGYRIKKARLLTRGTPKWMYAILVMIVIFIVPFGYIEVSQNVWKLNVLDYLASCAAGCLLFKTSVFLDRFTGKIASFFRLLGKNSMYILCIHAVEYLVIPWEYAERIMKGHYVLGFFAVLIARVLIIGVGCFVIRRIVRRKRKG